MKKILLTSFLLIMGTHMAESQSFSPDRPGIGNVSYITPKSMLGIEIGIQYSTNDFFNQIDVGQVVLRYGLAENLEFRALLNSYTSLDVDGPGGSNAGFQDMSVGAKYSLSSGNGGPSVSALAEVSLPVGSNEFTNNETVPSLGLLADYSINERWGISSNLGYSFEVGNQIDSWLFTLTPGVTLSDDIGGYFGYAGMYYGLFEEHWIEGGLAYGLNNGVQLDVNFGYDTESEVTFFGAGFAKGF